MKKSVIFTIGHSTRSIDIFIRLLQSHGIEELADVRSIPMSRRNPQFNTDALKQSLLKEHIQYTHFKNLGGLRPVRKESINLGWRNVSFRGYADYMATPQFWEGLESLMEIAQSKKTAIMCAEAVPWRCHRSLIADALISKGWQVKDIMTGTTATEHKPTPFLKMEKGNLMYPDQKERIL